MNGLTEKDVALIASVAAKEAVDAYKKQADNERRRQEQSKSKQAKKMLTSYRRLKSTIQDEMTLTPDEMVELRWKFLEDLMGSAINIVPRTERQIADIETKRKQDMYTVQCIDRAVELYRKECEASPYSEDIRRYWEMHAMYISADQKTISEIASDENVSEKTVYKDLNIACDAISVYLLGI